MKKTVILFIACMQHLTAIAADETLMLPPVVAPESFEQTIVRPLQTLTLKDALTLSLKHSPELATYAWGIRSREIDRIQAGLRPNPELDIEFENIAGSGDVSGTQSLETTVALSQLIELGDKRIKRQQIALSDYNLARWDYEIKRIDLLTKTASAFITVLSQQEMQMIRNETYALANDVHTSIQKRVKAGKATTLEEMKAQVEVSKARLETINAKRKLTTSRQLLATLWGDTEVTFREVIGDMYVINTPPDLVDIVNKINGNPDLARWVTVIGKERDAIALAQAYTTPDITVSAGVRHLNESDDVAAVASISVPLLFFDDKKTGVRRSEAELSRALKERDADELKLRSELMQNYQQLLSLYDEVLVLRDEILPVAETAFDSAKKIYQLGKLSLLGLLDTQRTYFEVRQQYIETLTAYQLMVINIERMIGGGLESFQ